MVPSLLSGDVHLSISWAVGDLVHTITTLNVLLGAGDLGEGPPGCAWTRGYTSQTNWL